MSDTGGKARKDVAGMTSKEALNQLYIMADTPELAIGIQSCYDIVEKDLEVLEIIRKNIYEGGYGFYFKNNLLQCTEDYKKIKEWLNDK